MGCKKGVPKSEAHKAALSAALKGRPLTKAHKRSISIGVRRYFDVQKGRTA